MDSTSHRDPAHAAPIPSTPRTPPARFERAGRAAAAACCCAGLVLLSGACGPETRRPATPRPEGDVPDRVVSLAPNLTEIVFAIGAGDRLAGRTTACDRPAEAVRIPAVGGFGRPSLERLLQLQPDLVLDVALEDEQAGRAIERAGIPRARIPVRTLDEIPAAIRRVGELLGRREPAEDLAGRIAAGLAARRNRPAPDRPPRVYAEIWPDPPMTAGRGAFVSELIELAGAVNLGGESSREYYAVSSERVIRGEPDILLILYEADAPAALRRIAARPGWRAIPAVRDGRIIVAEDLDLLLRPGPRILEALDTLEKAFQDAWNPVHPSGPTGTRGG